MISEFLAMNTLPPAVLEKICVLVHKPTLATVLDHAIEVCWDWDGALNSHGYGNVKIDGRNKKAHRVVFERVWGVKLPRRRVLDHLCRNRKCVNPWHTEPVTVRENTLRGNGASARSYRMARGLEIIVG
jgi:hypothetical protein